MKQTNIEGVLHPCDAGHIFTTFQFSAFGVDRLGNPDQQLMYWTGTVMDNEQYTRYRWWFLHSLPAGTRWLSFEYGDRKIAAPISFFMELEAICATV